MDRLKNLSIVENAYHKMGYTSCVYSLPIATDSPICFINENTSHLGRDKFAMDFIAPVGTIVYAPATGKVILVEQHFNVASHNPLDGDKVNQIVIRTSRNETYEVKHIQANGSKLRVGDYVSEGDELTKVDLNGFYIKDKGVEYPSHLHFAVHSNRFLSLQVRFKDYRVKYGYNGSVIFTKK